jgi:hypothetical protein
MEYCEGGDLEEFFNNKREEINEMDIAKTF